MWHHRLVLCYGIQDSYVVFCVVHEGGQSVSQLLDLTVIALSPHSNKVPIFDLPASQSALVER